MKKQVTKKVVKAMAIGVSALAASSVSAMTSMANDKNETTDDLAEETASEKVNSAVDEANSAVTDAKESGDALITGIETTDGVDDAVTDSKDAFNEEANVEAEDKTLAGDAVNEADKQVDNAIDAAGDTEAAMKDADSKADAAGDAADQAADAVSGAQADIDAYIEAIQNATTIEDANAAYDNVKNAVSSAQTAVSDAKKTYDEAKADYDAAILAATKADEDYQAAVAAAQAELDAALENLADVQDKGEALQEELEKAQDAYQAAVDAAQAAYDKAEADKKAAEEALNAADQAWKDADKKLTSAKQACEDADQKLKETEALLLANKGAIDIWEQEKVVQNGKQNNYTEADKLFDLIIKNYYVPNIIGADADSKVVYGEKGDSKFTKFSDDKLNYYKLTITDKDGNVQELYLNYKFESDKKNLIIFKKVPTQVVTEEGHDEQYVAADGSGLVISLKEYDEALGKWIIQIDEASYALDLSSENVTFEEDLKENQQTANVESGSEVKGDKVVITEKGDVITTEYDNKTIESEKEYASKTQAQAAADKVVADQVKDGDKNVNIDITTNVGKEVYDAEAEVSFVTKLTSTINFGGYVTDYMSHIASPKDKVQEAVESLLEKSGYHVFSSAWSKDTTTTKKDKKWNETKYEFKKGSLTVEYASGGTSEVDFSTLDWVSDLWDSIFHSDKQSKEQEIKKEYLEKKNIEIIDFSSWNWNFTEADITYLNHSNAKGSCEDAETQAKAEQNAKQNAISDANSQALKATTSATQLLLNAFNKGVNTTYTNYFMYEGSNKLDVSDVSDVKVKKDKEADTFNYKITFDKMSQTTESDVVLKITEFDAKLLLHEDAVEDKMTTIYTNDNYDKYIGNEKDASGIDLFEKTDKDFRDFLNNAEKVIKENEQAIADKAAADEELQVAQADESSKKQALGTAQNVFRGASEEYDKAKSALEAAKNATNYEELIVLAKKTNMDVATAKAKVELLKKAVDEMKESNIDSSIVTFMEAKLQVAEEKYNQAKDKADGLEDIVDDAKDLLDEKINDLTPDAPTTPNVPTAPAQPTTTIVDNATPLAQNPVADNTQVADEEAPVVIEDAEVPLAEGATEEKSGDVTIEDGEVPLIDFDSDDDEKMSWWWLLIVAALGGTGYEMYRKHKKNKLKD
ncbi:MAG: hypothetical protein Q4D54_03975 [Eubacteriales bacterium]|nr:hypothetical protein [Eubacteriales bacterium]